MIRVLPTKIVLSVLTIAIDLAFMPAPAVGDSFTFTTLPSSGKVAGAAGSVVGWGYSITNQSNADWLVTTDLSADPFQNASPRLLFDFPFLGPGQTVTESFNPLSARGLYELTWNSNALPSFTNSGNFVLSAQWWTGDPTGTGVFIADATDVNAPYTAFVGHPTAMPEPSTLPLVFAAITFIGLLVKLRFLLPPLMELTR